MSTDHDPGDEDRRPLLERSEDVLDIAVAAAVHIRRSETDGITHASWNLMCSLLDEHRLQLTIHGAR